ncbi:dihydroxyacetone kinase family protein [Nesterenkonia alkaliphila]|uniref:DAK2 domain-containing protein n=1 Tax=Nesterenkonia alkaliphila TaxID=1463631 RepID=A0A7K1UEW8_9MICC|nr:dihydroxyacetone kinase family protein [Nesterenkonia alkaliphila]MVT25020.1 DAK2 domain-containing protein [Nesterenkonia alkaliphila]GFZ87248.1 erythrulose kinase [Nesterenkonia alkaliphila]
MTFLVNSAPRFPEQALKGFAAAYPQYVTAVHGGVVRSAETPQGQPALVIGGGSGHYPAFAGWVGPGLGHGAPCGNIFSSPSASQVYSVARNAENGGGVLMGFGKYAGDVLHFGAAAEKLRAEGVDVRIVTVTDDIASERPENHRSRRGIAGDFTVFKITGAAIQAGADLDQAERIAWKANDATRSYGVAFAGCTLPGAEQPLFRVEEGMMAVGLGIHGEPGVKDLPMATAEAVADLLFDGIAEEIPDSHRQGGRVAVLLNGLGTVKYEDLFVVYRRVAERLQQTGLTPVLPEVGEFVTSLDMAGLSLTLVYLDDELETYWTAPVDTPAYRRGELQGLSASAQQPARTEFYSPGEEPVPAAAEDSRRSAADIQQILELFETVCRRHEDHLGQIDAVAGDGDHGQGMVLGSSGAAEAGRRALQRGAGARTLLVHAGTAWSESAGGTSGALWGAALTAAAAALSDEQGTDDAQAVQALVAAVDALGRLGGASEGDKTMMDAAVPFAQTLEQEYQRCQELFASVSAAAVRAKAAAEQTAEMSARLGRARVLGEKSLGTPDPGAVSFALLMEALGDHLGARR